MKPLIFFLNYSVIKKGIINNYFFIVLVASKNDFWASRCWLQLAQRASCKINFLCTLILHVVPIVFSMMYVLSFGLRLNSHCKVNLSVNNYHMTIRNKYST